MYDKKSIGKSLQACRKAAGYKTAELFAEQMGYNVKTYTGWEQGWSTFSLDKAWEMADALECSIDELTGRAKFRDRSKSTIYRIVVDGDASVESYSGMDASSTFSQNDDGSVA